MAFGSGKSGGETEVQHAVTGDQRVETAHRPCTQIQEVRKQRAQRSRTKIAAHHRRHRKSFRKSSEERAADQQKHDELSSRLLRTQYPAQPT